LEIRGIELGYANSEARLVQANAVGRDAQVLQQPVMVQLASNVMLVPIQVIRVLPQDLDSALGNRVKKYTRDIHKQGCVANSENQTRTAQIVFVRTRCLCGSERCYWC
jgi:hypothetical protein